MRKMAEISVCKDAYALVGTGPSFRMCAVKGAYVKPKLKIFFRQLKIFFRQVRPAFFCFPVGFSHVLHTKPYLMLSCSCFKVHKLPHNFNSISRKNLYLLNNSINDFALFFITLHIYNFIGKRNHFFICFVHL